MSRVLGKRRRVTELSDSLQDNTLWKRVDAHELPSLLDVLCDELATLKDEGLVRA
jgi:hypothetical protein